MVRVGQIVKRSKDSVSRVGGNGRWRPIDGNIVERIGTNGPQEVNACPWVANKARVNRTDLSVRGHTYQSN